MEDFSELLWQEIDLSKVKDDTGLVIQMAKAHMSLNLTCFRMNNIDIDRSRTMGYFLAVQDFFKVLDIIQAQLKEKRKEA